MQAQERKVDRLLEAMMSVGVSESATRKFKAEDAKLVALRGKLAALARSGRPKEPRG